MRPNPTAPRKTARKNSKAGLKLGDQRLRGRGDLAEKAILGRAARPAKEAGKSLAMHEPEFRFMCKSQIVSRKC